MANKKLESLPIKLMEQVFGSRYDREEFGLNAYIVKVTNRFPPSRPLLISTIGSAGDFGFAKENISKYFSLVHKHAKVLGQYSRERKDLGVVHITGGAGGIPYEMARIAKKENPELFSIAMYPRPSEKDAGMLQENKLPPSIEFYDWIVMSGLSLMKRGDNVARADINRAFHGGEGTLGEIATASHDGRIVVVTQLGNFGITQNVVQVLAYSYTDRGSVVIVENDPEKALRRAIAEHFANVERNDGVPLSNLDVYRKPENAKLYVNPRMSARVTTDSYPHLQLSGQLVLAGIDRDLLFQELTRKIGLNGDFKLVDLREGEEPHILRARPFLEELILSEINNIKAQALKGEVPYKVISHNLEVPAR